MVSIEMSPECFPAEFGLVLPKETKSLHGVLVLLPGSNDDGRRWLQDKDWLDFANEHSLVLLGAYYRDRPHDLMRVEKYCNMESGSGKALLVALKSYAAKLGVPSLRTLPLFLYGESAGGQFNYEFACRYPERVGAFVVNKGGFYWTHLAPKATRDVAGLFIVGENDHVFRVKSIEGIYEVNKTLDANWQLIRELGVEHGSEQSPANARKFFLSTLRT